MYCRTFREKVNDCLDRGVKPDARIMGHIAECADCGRYYRAQLDVHLRLGQSENVLVYDRQKIKSQVLHAIESKNSPKPQLRTAVLRRVAVAACLCAVAIMSLYMSDRALEQGRVIPDSARYQQASNGEIYSLIEADEFASQAIEAIVRGPIRREIQGLGRNTFATANRALDGFSSLFASFEGSRGTTGDDQSQR